MPRGVIKAHPDWIEPLSEALRSAGLKVYPSVLDNQILAIFRGPCEECDRLACAKIIIRKLASPELCQEWYEVVLTMPDGSRKEFEESSTSDADICHLIISYLVGFYKRDTSVEVLPGLPETVLVMNGGDVHLCVRFSQIE